MVYILKKVKERNKQFSLHPVTKKMVIRAWKKYIIFHITTYFKRELKYNWIHGLSFYVRKGDAGIVGNVFLGLYEFYDSLFLLHFLRKEDIFLDIGANVGHYSLLASGVNKCTSIAVEPIPDAFNQLDRQVRLNNLQVKVELLNCGAGKEKGSLFFSTNRNSMNRIVNENYKNLLRIPVRTIDSISSGRNINLIKIDVEGFEKFVLEGAVSTLKNNSLKAVIIEINNSGLNYGVPNDEICSILISYGFRPFQYNPHMRNLKQLKDYNHNQFNTIFIRDIEFVLGRLKKSQHIEIWNNFL